MKNKVLVFDDIIDLEYQEKIKKVLLSDYQYKGHEFPWYFTQDVTSHKDENSQKRSAFYHGYVMSSDDENTVGTVNSIFHYLLNPLIENACHRVGEKNVNILKGRSFLQLPINYKGEREDTPHIDISDLYHFVMLYYVCDSDGDTIIFNEQEESEKYTVQKRVTPKQGRVVLFDGRFYHTAEQPVDNIRCVVNYDLTPRFMFEKTVLV